MCLGIPAQLVSIGEQHPDLATVDMAGVKRSVNVALLDVPVAAGGWILVHMGFALEVITEQEAKDALAALDAENAAERDAIAALPREGEP